jgi:hypothetical protein
MLTLASLALFTTHVSAFGPSSPASVFSSEDISQCTRIRSPELVKTGGANFLVFATCCGKNACGHISEGRNSSLGDDHSESKVILTSSSDNGRTWGKAQFLADGKTGYSNVNAIYDTVTDELVVQYIDNGNDNSLQKTYQVMSKDQGKTWSKPVDLTEQLKACPKTGATAGTRTQTSTGRLLWYGGGTGCLWWSDDHGKTYHAQNGVGMTNEISFLNVVNHTNNHSYLFANGRAFVDEWKPNRVDFKSHDNGETWERTKSVLKDAVGNDGMSQVERSLLWMKGRIFTAEPKGTSNPPKGKEGSHYDLVVSCSQGTNHSEWKFSKSVTVNSGHYAGYSSLGEIPGDDSLLVVWDHEKDDEHTVGGAPLFQTIDTKWCN